jgi:radical SAM superfamily enzyme YgiQ (UPF0313 family)
MPDLLCVYPNNRRRAFGSLGEVVAAITPPLQTALIAAYARERGCSVGVLDADAEGLTADETAGRVAAASPALTCISTDYLNSGDVTKMAAAEETVAALRRRAPGLPTMLEGVVPSAYPERVLRDAGGDFVLQGEGFAAVVALVEELREGRPPSAEIEGVWSRRGGEVSPSHRPPMEKEVDRLPMAAWDLLPMKRYRAHHWHCFDDLGHRQPYGSIYTNLGCPYACTFCNVNVVYGGPSFRTRTPENVVEEITYLVHKHGVRNLRIVDNVFTVRKDLVERLCDLIIRAGHDLNVWVYARVETVDYPLLKKMRQAGIRWVAYGIEAGTKEVRKGVAKGSSQEVIDRAIEATQRAGINIVGNFIFGLPDDTLESMQATLQMAKDYAFEYANFYSAMAYPGTELHEQARAAGTKLPDSWDGYGQYSENALPTGSRHLSPADVLRFRDRAFVEYFSDPAYLGRLEQRFGPDAAAFTREILKHRIRRRILEG